MCQRYHLTSLGLIFLSFLGADAAKWHWLRPERQQYLSKAWFYSRIPFPQGACEWQLLWENFALVGQISRFYRWVENSNSLSQTEFGLLCVFAVLFWLEKPRLLSGWCENTLRICGHDQHHFMSTEAKSGEILPLHVPALQNKDTSELLSGTCLVYVCRECIKNLDIHLLSLPLRSEPAKSEVAKLFHHECLLFTCI